MRPFRFGVQLTLDDAARSLEQSREAEALGYDSITVPDHVRGGLSPIPALMAIAGATRSARLGTLVLNAALRNPRLLTAEASTVAELAGGRFELGVGAGWDGADFEAAGMPFPPGTDRFRALERTVSLWKTLSPGRDAAAPPRPPLLIAGGGRRVLALAAKEADIVGVHVPVHGAGLSRRNAESASETPFARRVGWVRESAGPRFSSIELNVFAPLCRITGQGAEMRARVGEALGLAGTEVNRSPLVLIGSIDEVADVLQERRDRFGLSYVVVPAKGARAFAPVVERLRGK